MLQRLLVAVLALSLAACVFAQPDPQGGAAGGPGGGRQGGGMMAGGPGGGFNMQTPMTEDNTKFEVNAFGIFVIHNGVVAKYNPNLNPVGVKELFDPLPAQPQAANPQNPTDEERANSQAWMQMLNERQGPFAELVKDEMLHLVIGGHYFRVNMKTLNVEAKAELKAPGDAEANGRQQRFQLNRQAPMLKMDGNTLYVLGNQALFAVNTVNGAVTNAVMPKEMFPTVDYRGLMGGIWGGGGRNNNGANNPGGPGGNPGGNNGGGPGGNPGGGRNGGGPGGGGGGNRGGNQPQQ